MKKGVNLIIKSIRQVPTQRDAYEFILDFQTLDLKYIGLPEAPKKVKQHKMLIGITGTLAAMWNNRGLDGNGMEKTLLELARRRIVEKIREGTLTNREEYQLATSNSPADPPFETSLINVRPGYEEEIVIQPEDTQNRLTVGTQITDILDNINAIFYEQHKELLFRPREFRAPLELIRSANNREEFVYRIAALGNVIDGLNKEVLQKVINEKDENYTSIILLGKYLIQKEAEGKTITKTLQDILKIRKAYPIHSDSIGGVVQAHRDLGIEYPISDYNSTWEKLLQEFKACCNEIMKTIVKNSITTKKG